jgi:two-component system cell cycle response regulator DivK
MPSVLLIEPDDDGREMYVEFLTRAGLRPIAVDNARDALEHAPDVDVIVTGIRLRGEIDGIELVSRLRRARRTRHIPNAVVTACAWHTERQRAEEAGCDVFLMKPCLPADLLAELQRLLAFSKELRAISKQAKADGAALRRQSHTLRRRSREAKS